MRLAIIDLQFLQKRAPEVGLGPLTAEIVRQYVRNHQQETATVAANVILYDTSICHGQVTPPNKNARPFHLDLTKEARRRSKLHSELRKLIGFDLRLEPTHFDSAWVRECDEWRPHFRHRCLADRLLIDLLKGSIPQLSVGDEVTLLACSNRYSEPCQHLVFKGASLSLDPLGLEAPLQLRPSITAIKSYV